MHSEKRIASSAIQRLLPVALLILAAAGPVSAQPLPPVRLSAEWEPSFGTLIRWPLGIPSELVVELARDDSLYVLVENTYEQSQAEATFSSWGVNLDNCRFIMAETYSHWTRDWGPHSMFDGEGVWGIIDPIFDGYPWIPGGPYASYMRSRGYWIDNAVNATLAEEFSCPLHQFPAYLTGGNFMTDGHGGGFSTHAMLTENEAFWSHSEFLELSEQWLGLESYFVTVNPEDYGLQHIDCHAKLLDEETILLKEVDTWHPDYDRIETINDQLTTAVNCYGRQYDIVRIYCGPYSGNNVAAYTNSYILNTKVLVPLFGIGSDEAALETYEEAMPGYEVIGIYYDAWYYYDALHCRTREIMDREMLLIWHRRLDDEMTYQEEYVIEAMVHAYSGAALVPEELLVGWRVDGGEWQSSPLSVTGPDSVAGAIPGQPYGSVIDYYVQAADYSGRQERLPRSAPDGFYRFTVVPPTGTAEGSGAAIPDRLEISPNPSGSIVNVSFSISEPGHVEITVYDLSGRAAGKLEDAFMEAGSYMSSWTADTVPSGCYIVRMTTGTGAFSEYVLVIR